MTVRRYLWGSSSEPYWLLGAAAVLLLVKLGAAELWTLEGRWAAVSARMLQSGDYLHPYLYGGAYYDKPLVSYWLMIAAARAAGRLSETALRLPSALSGLLSVWLLYRIGRRRFDASTGLIAGFLLTTCYMFVFWSRVASADVLNVAGTLAAVAWYFERKDRPGFTTSAVLFSIVGFTCLMKGLICAVVVVLALLPDLLHEGYWRRMLRPSLLPAALIGATVYLLPFLGSLATQPAGYGESGLAMVVRENALRYFDAFDHQDPIWVYLVHLPIYLLPWSLLLPFALWSAIRRWPSMSAASRWPIWTCLLIFVFLTVSSSRRSYYVLPIVPFGVLMIAEWLHDEGARSWAQTAAAGVVAVTFAGMLLWFGVIVPAGFRRGGERLLVRAVRSHAETEAPWKDWRIVLCGAPPAAGYYFRTGQEVTVVPIADLQQVAPLVARDPHTIVVTKRRFAEEVRALVPAAAVFEEPSRVPGVFRPKQGSERDLIAFVP